jgi:DivIVA domain-containing protein
VIFRGACHRAVSLAWHDRRVLLPIVLGILVSAGVIFAVFAVTVGHGGSMTQFQPDWPGRPLPEDRAVRAADVTAARFSLAFRGYRMAEVDDALDRLAGEIADRDYAIEQLTGRPYEPPQPPPIEPVAELAPVSPAEPVAERAPNGPVPPAEPFEPTMPIDELDSGH